MAGKGEAVRKGADLAEQVVRLAASLGLETATEVRVGRRIWGAERRIDVVLTQTSSLRRLGVECKSQGVAGSAEEKIPTTVQDIAAWPIPGIVVFSGEGLSDNMESFLLASGKAVHLDDLEPWLRLFFGLPIGQGDADK